MNIVLILLLFLFPSLGVRSAEASSTNGTNDLFIVKSSHVLITAGQGAILSGDRVGGNSAPHTPGVCMGCHHITTINKRDSMNRRSNSRRPEIGSGMAL